MEYLHVSVLLPALLAFVIGIVITPFVTHLLYQHKAWKKTGGKQAIGGHEAIEFNRLKGVDETKTPRMGGIVIWGSVLLTAGLLTTAAHITELALFMEMEFISRSQTWIPLATLLVGAGIGLLNDFYDIAHTGRGLRLSERLIAITILSGSIGWWFYDKLEVTSIAMPFAGELTVGWGIVPFFIILTQFLYASGVIDGIDGLSGGVFASIFGAYSGIALINGQVDLAAFCAVVVGSILAFLWFNIPPARFWMTETGSMALTLTLAVVVLMTDSLGGGYGLLLLPIVGLLLVITVMSNILQISYRILFKRKLFRIAPLHHHFEAIGWPPYKVTMRYWIISLMCASTGVVLAAIL
jgi:phospho-N-acetylmuramoyl-pentapeptide-transferase